MAGCLSAFLQEPATAELTPDDEIVSVKEIPMGSLHLVERADGNIFFVSQNKRFAVVGEVYDLWTGKNVLELDHFDQLDWARSGVDMQQITFQQQTEKRPDAVLFVSQVCESCAEIVSEIQDISPRSVAAIPIHHKKEIGRLPEIWCEPGANLAILSEWLQTSSELGVSQGCESIQGARAHAFADVYDIRRDIPVLIDSTGNIHNGTEEIRQWLKQ
jgi:hypothetical protein